MTSYRRLLIQRLRRQRALRRLIAQRMVQRQTEQAQDFLHLLDKPEFDSVERWR